MRTLRPAANELAVFLLNPGETVVIETERGPYRLGGEDPTHPYPEVQVCLVPHTPGAVGWFQTTCATYGAGLGNARTPTGLRVTALRRYVRGHKHDEQVWQQVRTLLGDSPRACYVRIEPKPYYNKTRHTAVSVRAHQEDQ